MMKTNPIRLASFTLAVGCLAVLALASPANAQSSSLEFPYQALVAKDNALVRSGPGEVHYGTQKLPAGQVVEVYRHDPDGWCAIRPVEGSFSIIPASTVEITGEGVGEVKMAGTTPFVGTKLGTVEKPLWQVKLREKEKVSLIGQLSWPSPEGHSTIWYQIEPPAGEFRWINISNLESLAGETMASMIRPKPSKTEAVPQQPQPQQSKPIASSVVAAASPIADLARQPSVTPVKPSFDSATAQQNSNALLAAQSRDRAVEPNQFEASQPDVRPEVRPDVQLASFAAPDPPKPAAPPLQDSGGGWRRATREIPSDSSSKSSNDGFTQYAMPNDNRSQFDSSSNYNNSRTANQNQQNFGRSESPQIRAYESYNLNSGSRPQASFSGQIRVADGNPDPNRFAQQLGQARGFAQTYTGTSNSLQTLNNRLTMEMLKAPSAWQLAPLEAATRQLMSTTANYAEQQAGTKFLAKLENCRRVAEGYGNGGSSSNRSGLSNASSSSRGQLGYDSGSGNPASQFGSNVNIGSNTFGSRVQSNPQFDATGWLNELKQARGTDPSTYVLQDASGKIIYHVTPMPGLNLSRYLKKRIGVNGQLGFNQKLNLRHVTIERVFSM